MEFLPRSHQFNGLMIAGIINRGLLEASIFRPLKTDCFLRDSLTKELWMETYCLQCQIYAFYSLILNMKAKVGQKRFYNIKKINEMLDKFRTNNFG